MIWIERRIVELTGFEDELVINFAKSQLEEAASKDNISGNNQEKLCPKKMQINLTGFMEEKTPVFM